MATKPQTIDEYLATVSADKRAALEKLRRDIKAAAPRAEECISYDIPGFRLNGKLLVSFGAAANHCAFYPGARPVRVHKDELEAYDTNKGTIRFPTDTPLPAALVRKLVKSRIAERGPQNDRSRGRVIPSSLRTPRQGDPPMSSNSPRPDGVTKRAEPESLRGRNLSASLTVKDLGKSLAWYQDVVGFTVDRKHEREGTLVAVSLKAGDVRILIGQDDGAKGWDRVKGAGFSLQITTIQNIDEIANRIKERGGILESEPKDMPWGARIFRLRDPDGFTLVISSVPAN